jgi:non-canonical purine NTP pyrophosphatase (RdgB/HAM1 family)
MFNSNPPLGLYIHLPWCEKKCPYCDFNSHETDSVPQQAYVDALLDDLAQDLPLICEGSWEGVIQLEPAGNGGFGYDPYFFLPQLGCTSAELSATEKNCISHRGQALAELKRKLKLND